MDLAISFLFVLAMKSWFRPIDISLHTIKLVFASYAFQIYAKQEVRSIGQVHKVDGDFSQLHI